MGHASTPYIMSYLAVRRALGLLGLCLPISLLIYAQVFGRGMQPSISEFYHTEIGDAFVGVLISIGVFLFVYKGYKRKCSELLSDNVIAKIAGIGIIFVAVFPVEPPTLTTCFGNHEALSENLLTGGITIHWCGYEWIHALGAALFFYVCAYIAFFCSQGLVGESTGPRAKTNCTPCADVQ